MILDELLEIADAVSVAASAGTAAIGDVIDLGSAHRDIGSDEEVYFVITVDTAFVAAGAGTIEFRLVSAATSDVTSSPTIHYSTGALVTAASTPAGQKAGKTICAVILPREGNTYLRYLGLLCVIATQTVSAGKINAFLTKDISQWAAYADATN